MADISSLEDLQRQLERMTEDCRELEMQRKNAVCTNGQLRKSLAVRDQHITHMQTTGTEQVERIRALQIELTHQKAIITTYEPLLDLLVCPVHGRCLLHAIEKVTAMRDRLAALEMEP